MWLPFETFNHKQRDLSAGAAVLENFIFSSSRDASSAHQVTHDLMDNLLLIAHIAHPHPPRKQIKKVSDGVVFEKRNVFTTFGLCDKEVKFQKQEAGGRHA